MSIELHRFFVQNADALKGGDETVNRLQEQCSITNCSSAFLVGQKRSCLTSFVLHYAMTYGMEDREVLFFARKGLQNIEFAFPAGEDSFTKAAMKRVKIKYVEDCTSMIHTLAHVHLLKRKPELIIVDDFRGMVGCVTADVSKVDV
ncbi:hypothetical protein PROFUN_12256 [Planoprotostelium fungivorum]|uniref:Uncharacterized protein n=1 Tax=Planoprotostelium fungivorum TaxID=1890364 RepID=A0A2P6N827_9EUKA|nr:hypothetical protein PROFUN_12256 [Planoprotostelium fungivorum]